MSTYLVAAAEPNQSLNILVTGFVVVFAVLLLLIGLIKLYSVIVYSAQTKIEKKKAEKAALDATQSVTATNPTASAPVASTAPADGSVDLQTVAVITAAAEAYYSDKAVRVTGISRVSGARSEWAAAGIRDSISMRSEGLF